MKWSDRYNVNYYHCDYRKMLKPGFAARYMNETAHNALINLGPHPDTLEKAGRAFLLSRISFRFLRPVYSGDEIAVSTWAVPAKAAMFTRYYRVARGHETVIEAASNWAFVSVGDRKILRASDTEASEMLTDDETIGIVPPRRISMPGDAAPAGERAVRYSDIDQYLHLNNTAYLDIVADTAGDNGEGLPFGGCYVAGLDIIHHNEAAYGAVLGLRRSAAEDGIYVSALLPDGSVCFDSRVITAPVP